MHKFISVLIKRYSGEYMNWKILLSVFIILSITGLLMFSDKGKDIRDISVSTVGNLFKSITGRFQQVTLSGKSLNIVLTIDRVGLRSQEFSVQETDFDSTLIFEKVSINDQNIGLGGDTRRIDFFAKSMAANVLINEGLGMEVSGQTNFIELNDIIFTPQEGKKKMNFLVSGIPINFYLSSVERNEMLLNDASGELKIEGIDSSLMLAGDRIKLVGFVGTITQGEETAMLKGDVNRIVLNGIDLSLI